MSDYPRITWDKNMFEQAKLVRTNMTAEDWAKFKNQFTPLILDDSPSSDNVRKLMLLSYLSRKYNIKPTLNPKREHWLIRLVNDYFDGKVSSVDEFVERYKEQKKMKPKFEIGDKVIEKEPCFGGYGYVTSINHYNDPDCYVVKFANGDERVSYIEDFCVEDSEIKEVFLTRLQELLATFDASIYDYEQYKLCIDLGCGEQLEWYWGNKPMNDMLTAENVFDYDKD